MNYVGNVIYKLIDIPRFSLPGTQKSCLSIWGMETMDVMWLVMSLVMAWLRLRLEIENRKGS